MGKKETKVFKDLHIYTLTRNGIGDLEKKQKHFRLLTINSHCTNSTKIVFEKADNVTKHHSPLI